MGAFEHGPEALYAVGMGHVGHVADIFGDRVIDRFVLELRHPGIAAALVGVERGHPLHLLHFPHRRTRERESFWALLPPRCLSRLDGCARSWPARWGY